MTGPAAAAPAARHVDFHLHSTASDGALSPEAVVAAACAAHLGAIALTDHDTVEGLDAARAAAAPAGLEVVNGVELSAYEGAVEVHILGLHLSMLGEIRDRLAIFRRARVERAEAIVGLLNGLGVRITFADVTELAKGAAIGRPHIARALVENGWAMDLRDAFDRYLGAGRPAYLDKHRIGIADAVGLIHESGGIAVVAHPGPDGTRERIESMVPMGIDGVEVIHPSHSAEDRARLLALTRHFGLVPSGGSDSHGTADGSRIIGSMKVPGEWLELQRERADAVRARVARA